MSHRHFIAALAAFALIGACGIASAQQAPRPAAGTQTVLHGAGATFPAPLYKKWIAEYAKANPGVAIDYKEVGSGEGIQRFIQNAVDFGASDAAMSDEQIAQVKGGVSLVPTAAGMVVLAYNLTGLGGPLKLNRSTYVEMLAGRIAKWNDPRIQASNPGLKLPNKNIALVVRQDSSGTTFALTNHLNAIDNKWRVLGRNVGTVVGWVGNVMLARGNEGVAARIKISEGAIGYVEYGFAKRLGLPMAHLENKAGRYVEPSAATGQAALASNLKSVPDNMRAFLPDPEGEDSYPIVSLTWLLLYQHYADEGKRTALKRFVNWALTEGQSFGSDIGYVALPPDLAGRAKAAVDALQ